MGAWGWGWVEGASPTPGSSQTQTGQWAPSAMPQEEVDDGPNSDCNRGLWSALRRGAWARLSSTDPWLLNACCQAQGVQGVQGGRYLHVETTKGGTEQARNSAATCPSSLGEGFGWCRCCRCLAVALSPPSQLCNCNAMHVARSSHKLYLCGAQREGWLVGRDACQPLSLMITHVGVEAPSLAQVRVAHHPVPQAQGGGHVHKAQRGVRELGPRLEGQPSTQLHHLCVGGEVDDNRGTKVADKEGVQRGRKTVRGEGCVFTPRE
jgi:hypothetical protein